MSPMSYAPLPVDAGDGTSALPFPATLTVSTVAAAAVGVGHHLLKVSGYSILKHTHGDTGSYLESGEFMAGGHAWRVRCYLNGNRDENTGYVSLYLQHAGAGSVVHAKYEFELVALWPLCSRIIKKASVVAFKADQMWGYKRFIAVKDLEGSGFLRDDGFAIRCKVTVVEERSAAAGEVTAEDMDRVGVVCACKDEACKFKHERPAETLREKIALICRFICGDASS